MTRLRVLLLKEWRESMRNKMVLFGVILLPVVMVAISIVMLTTGEAESDPIARIVLFNTSLLYFMVLPVIIPHGDRRVLDRRRERTDNAGALACHANY